MVRDDVTGLIWEVKTDDGGIHDKDNEYAWEEDSDEPNVQNDFIAVLNSERFGGSDDWRLPTIREFYTIVQNIETDTDNDPKINTDYFSNIMPSHYWSSNNYDSNRNCNSCVWGLHFGKGCINHHSKSGSIHALAVRGAANTSHFVDNEDGTVTDKTTGLMWQKLEVLDENGAVRKMTWQEALAYCEGLEMAGRRDWRLPNIKELQSIVDYKTHDPSIDTTIFPGAWASNYWSATTFVINTEGAWPMDFYDGDNNIMVFTSNKSISYYVRAVRGGQ
jgi:hypothetical protein